MGIASLHPSYALSLKRVTSGARFHLISIVKEQSVQAPAVSRRAMCPSFSSKFIRPENKRAQGRPGARCTRGPCAKKVAHGSHHRCWRISPAFPAQWF